jgi:arylsulfatase A-like enzyme
MTHHNDHTNHAPAAPGKLPRVILIVMVLILVCAGLWGGLRQAPTPNILVISLCSVRADHLGCYGYPRATSPHLDRLASESTVFEHAVTQWPKTAPAFGTLMTGAYAHTTGVTRITPHQFLGDDHETLSEVLRDNGYATGVFN